MVTGASGSPITAYCSGAGWYPSRTGGSDGSDFVGEGVGSAVSGRGAGLTLPRFVGASPLGAPPQPVTITVTSAKADNAIAVRSSHSGEW